MENNTPTAGKTAKVNLTEAQQDRLIEITKRLGAINILIKRTGDQAFLKSMIVFHGGIDSPIAVTANSDIRNFIDANGKSVETMYAPDLFKYINEYLIDIKDGILEEIFSIYQEGGAK